MNEPRLDYFYRFRQGLLDYLKRDLLGPLDSDSEELIEDPPITRYMVGILYPPELPSGGDGGSNEAAAEDDQELAGPATGSGSDGSGEWDEPVNRSRVRYPSSMGMSFAVDGALVDSLTVLICTASYAPYDGASSEAGLTAQLGDSEEEPSCLEMAEVWKRSPVRPEPISLSVRDVCRNGRKTIHPGLDLYFRVRRPDAAGVQAVTLMLVNTQQAPSGELRDAYSWFQPVIQVTTPTSSAAAFVAREGSSGSFSDTDLESYRLIYRDSMPIAVGHGCSVEWERAPDQPARAVRVSTSMIPTHDLRLSDSNPDIDVEGLGMKRLAEAKRSKVLSHLHDFTSAYEDWIDGQTEGATHLPESISGTAERHLGLCRESVKRIRGGLDLLERDSDAWEAFRVANRSMLMQRARSDWIRRGAEGIGPDLDGPHVWRPFQMAFMLQCLAGIADRNSPERAVADLLWFPTGGGKTEAYLGLIAFTIALRRLRDPDHGHGVTVLMRYTLRLLTTQQFERAALLILSLEAIRREETERLGNRPIEIGLWVGDKATPNTRQKTRSQLTKLRQGREPEESNPLQIRECPWCGTELTPRDLYLAKAEPRLVCKCGDPACFFSDELPVRIIDEDIYDRHPALIIATSDKFASLPWLDSCSSLFNLDLYGVSPPELIVQDELHLISGPLGTLAGLYETAIDELCKKDGRRPKIVASTATIRSADEQTAALFDRAVRQFPPPALDARDSYFAKEAPASEKGTRLYAGVMTAASQTTLLIRVYAALLQAAQELPGSDRVRDPYWTLVGYFNSLRVLGGARMQVQDDVTDRLRLLAGRSSTQSRSIEDRIELTSRESSGAIPERLRQMSVALPGQALDVILATNMISVGVDVERLGLMAVMGQPQSTAEYIQASSRVGRRYPGLVVTMFNSAKSRDRSHYESFVGFHGSLYTQVESSSVTPFSAQARRRALHAVFVALARHTVPGLQANDSARKVGRFTEELDRIQKTVLKRAERVDSEEVPYVELELRELRELWLAKAADHPDLVYSDIGNPERALLTDASLEDETADYRTLPTLWSLRDVDRSSNLYVEV